MNAPLNPQQREYQRYPFQEDILVNKTTMCMSNNIGRNGLFVSTQKCFDKNSIVTVDIPFQGENIMVRAKIRFCQKGIGMGMEFVEVSDEQGAKINSIIEHAENHFSMS